MYNQFKSTSNQHAHHGDLSFVEGNTPKKRRHIASYFFLGFSMSMISTRLGPAIIDVLLPRSHGVQIPSLVLREFHLSTGNLATGELRSRFRRVAPADSCDGTLRHGREEGQCDREDRSRHHFSDKGRRLKNIKY